MRKICTPITEDVIKDLKVGDTISISGYIFTGRDAVLPKMVKLAENDGLEHANIDLQGSVIFHTAVSRAGVGPTSSNKFEIESSIKPLSEAGVKLHLGKGAISKETVKALDDNQAVYAVIPPVTALLESRTIGREVVAFEEEGMEAFHRIEVRDYPAIIAAAHGEQIF